MVIVTSVKLYVIKSVAAKCVAAECVAAECVAVGSGSCRKIPLPDIVRAEQKVACAKQVTPRYSLVGGAYDHDCIFFSRSVLQRLDLQIVVLAPIAELVIRVALAMRSLANL